MTLTLTGRLQTRVLLVLLVGVAWTAVITPFLPRPGWLSLTAAYRGTFTNLALMAVTGLAWEFVYHMLQQLRWDKDWPSLLALATVVNEGLAVWFAGHAFGLIDGPVGFSSPMLPSFVVHFVTAYVAIWAVMQGPLRVLLVRWRFAGGRLIDPASRGGPSRDDEDARPVDPLPAVTRGAAHGACPADGALVDGILCQERHFNHPRALYCAFCGTSLRAGGHSRVRAPRPPLGILIADDGTTCVVDRDIAVVSEPALRFERINGDAPEPCPLQIRLRDWQCVAVADRCVAASLPDGRQLLLEPNSSLPLLPGTELLVDGCRILFEGRHQQTVRIADVLDERRGLPPAEEFGTQAREVAARLVAYLTTFAAMVLAVHIVLVVFGSNPGSVIASGVRRLAAILDLGFQNLFTPADGRLRVILNDGLAAVAYLVGGYAITQLPKSRRRRRANDE